MITIFPRILIQGCVLAFLDAFNGKDNGKIIYTDMAEQITKLTKR